MDEDVETLLRREPGNREHDHVVRLRAELLPELVPRGSRAGRPARRTPRRRSCSRTRAPSRDGAPRATIERRASVPVTRTPEAPRRRAARRRPSPAAASPDAAPRRGSRRRRTYGTPRTRLHTIAACAANVLQPETTTTSGPRARERARDARRDRIVVVKDCSRARARAPREGTPRGAAARRATFAPATVFAA